MRCLNFCWFTECLSFFRPESLLRALVGGVVVLLVAEEVVGGGKLRGVVGEDVLAGVSAGAHLDVPEGLDHFGGFLPG